MTAGNDSRTGTVTTGTHSKHAIGVSDSKSLNTKPSISELLASTGELEDNSITSQSKRRPTGVTILAVLGFITAIFAVLGGLGLIFISTLSVEIEYFVIFGVILLALGIITPSFPTDS